MTLIRSERLKKCLAFFLSFLKEGMSLDMIHMALPRGGAEQKVEFDFLLMKKELAGIVKS